MENDQELPQNEAKQGEARPTLPASVQRVSPKNNEPDIGGFIKQIKSESDLPDDITAALKEARSRIQMDIPDPPADLWDPELDDLSRLPSETFRGSSSVTDFSGQNFEKTPSGKSVDDFLGGDEWLLNSSRKTADDDRDLDTALFDFLSPLNQVQPVNEDEDLTNAVEALKKDGPGEEVSAEKTKEVDDTDTNNEVPVKAAVDVQRLDAKEPVVTSPETIAHSDDDMKDPPVKRAKFNPWSLFFGKNNLVDTTATLIFMHAVLLLALELAWKRMPLDFLGVSKNGFTGFVIATAGIQVLTLLFPMFLSFNSYRLSSGTVLGKTQIDRPMILASLLLGVPAALFFNGINNIFTFLLISWDVTLPSYILPKWTSPIGLPELGLTLLVAAVVPSILEELFFRGFLMKSLYGIRGKKVAIFLSALAFAFFHNDPLFFIGPLGVGILLGYLRKNSESVLPAILTHLSINVATFLLDPVLPRFNAQMVMLFPADGRTNLTANLVATVSSGIVLFFIYRFINENLVRSRAYTGFTTGRRAAIYGRNQMHKQAVLSSPDRQYEVPLMSFANYVRFFLACGIWIVSRFLA